MTKAFALDLKVARKNSGLTQEDCAHLLGVCDATLAKMEGGTRTPTVREIRGGRGNSGQSLRWIA